MGVTLNQQSNVHNHLTRILLKPNINKNINIKYNISLCLMKEILKKIKPTKTEQQKLKAVTTAFLKKLNSKLKLLNSKNSKGLESSKNFQSDAKAILGGSGAKDTWLAGNHDIDIFVQFDFKKYADRSANLTEDLEAALKKAFPQQKKQRLHGSRDYFQMIYKNYNFEVIPILKITKAEQALNITDISPLHAQWVNKNTKKLKDEIRLAKQFCKANKLYGAESHITGFSGYVLEILIAFYGSFEKLLQATRTWNLNKVIDPENYYKKKDVFFHLNRSKLQSPLIVIDPVDKSRNAAAALSKEKFMLFKKMAREYLKRPDKKFFEREEVSFARLKAKAKNDNLVFVTLTPRKGKEDVVGVKLLKVFRFLKKGLEKFAIKKADWDWDGKGRATFYLVLKKRQLPDFEVRQGPPLELKEFVKDFKKKNKDAYEEKGRIFARIKIKHPQLEDFVKDIVKGKYVKERVKAVQKVQFD